MLSYRHAFHAGNHADILKHFVLGEVLSYMCAKDKAIVFIDTHAGAGYYDLDGNFAQKKQEYATGIKKIKQLYLQNKCNKNILPMVKIIEQININKGTTNIYPGSAGVAEFILRSEDKLILSELHTNEVDILTKNFSNAGRRIKIFNDDGFVRLKAVLPPSTRRACVLIDPSYEIKSDYHKVISAVQDSLNRFALGTYIIWYPKVAQPLAQNFVEKLKNLAIGFPIKGWLQAELLIDKKIEFGVGMFGSGVFVINPPWKLPETLKQTFPWLTEVLAISNYAKFNLEYEIP